ncbi:uncharacterized protein LOC121385931 [Gigantopelta aegis]|uniref:uncharacterized protein LOC121385931 n=1 Tax=Gigantopelta aegis TaxID=1735272 RepID=UPI001B88B259|nr:uncharacterized protein LOC121385931 [Gigantopelta aegis]
MDERGFNRASGFRGIRQWQGNVEFEMRSYRRSSTCEKDICILRTRHVRVSPKNMGDTYTKHVTTGHFSFAFKKSVLSMYCQCHGVQLSDDLEERITAITIWFKDNLKLTLLAQIVSEKRSLKLTCTVEAHPDVPYTFSKFNHSIQGVVVRQLTGTRVSNSLEFTIQPYSYEDYGRYTCVAENEFTTRVVHTKPDLKIKKFPLVSVLILNCFTVKKFPLAEGSSDYQMISAFRHQKVLLSKTILSDIKTIRTFNWTDAEGHYRKGIKRIVTANDVKPWRPIMPLIKPVYSAVRTQPTSQESNTATGPGIVALIVIIAVAAVAIPGGWFVHKRWKRGFNFFARNN